MAVPIVDTEDGVREMMDAFTGRERPLLLFFDLEGDNLSRDGTLDILQVHSPALGTVHLVDVFKLQHAAFTTASRDGQTLQSILESAKHPKVFFDVRSDSDALHYHFEIGLQGVIDLQLLEFATRPVRGKYLKGLQKCIAEARVIPRRERQTFDRIKEEGTMLFAPERGGNYKVFQQRPLDALLIAYCAQDVRVLPALLEAYAGRLSDDLAVQVQNETLARVELSHSDSFVSKGRHMALGPRFAWSSRGTLSALEFPISLVCSPELGDHCQLLDTQPAASDRDAVQTASESPASGDEADTTVIAITQSLQTMQITGRRTTKTRNSWPTGKM